MSTLRSLTVAECDQLRMRNVPTNLTTLLVAESPPKRGFFYLASDSKTRGLFYETMSVIYGNEFCRMWDHTPSSSMSELRNGYLCRFRADGYYLADASKRILSGMEFDEKLEHLQSDAVRTSLLSEMQRLIPEDSRKDIGVILITKSVFVAYSDLLEESYCVLNDCVIPFPRYEWQKKIFHEELSKLLADRGR